MGDSLLEGGAVQGLVAGHAPPFDCGIDQARSREMMSQHFWFSRRLVGEAAPQSLSDAAMQDLATALQKILVSCVLNERMLESITAFGRRPFHQHDVGIGKLFQGGFQRRIVDPGDGLQ